MANLVYMLCALTSLACAVLLGRAYRANRVALLFWSTVCFVALALANVLLFVDLTMVVEQDLRLWRSGTMLIGVSALLYGLTLSER
jgi:hypothetical protein